MKNIFKEIHCNDVQEIQRYTAGSPHWFTKLEIALTKFSINAKIRVENDVV